MKTFLVDFAVGLAMGIPYWIIRFVLWSSYWGQILSIVILFLVYAGIRQGDMRFKNNPHKYRNYLITFVVFLLGLVLSYGLINLHEMSYSTSGLFLL
jgi:hypothetical protein